MIKFEELLPIACQLNTAEVDLFRIGAPHILLTCLVIAYLSYALFSLILAVASSVEHQPPFSAHLESTIDSPLSDFPQIDDWHLFGQTLSKNNVDKPGADTQLQPTLLAVLLLSQEPESALAIIQTEAGY
ncbi:MAG: type II secretion system protein N [Methylococcaceae bacterium]|nr:type II secretion system protein N [Methylococcaceae bacterium]MDZ4155463.1 type II secretion system protein N [Methylococcales bacterium]MDP2392148.1 type II secretion system protein N [Methylococcaceae bacterium]MDP3019420.1 type II secretion system protein N [Methylococcaceae bacterium]MDP3388647.1 type II secretion system protein N [Methylococcaceae bacterium]